MNERRHFLKVVGAGAVAVGAGCAGVDDLVISSGSGASGAGGSGAGGTDTGGSGTGGTGTGGSTTTGTNCTTSPPGTKIGALTTYAATGLHIVANKGLLIGRDAGGLYALTAICTHQSCDMSTTNDGELLGKNIYCRCHGSEFSPTGAVVKGPANVALRAYALALGCDGFLYVNKAKTVAVTVRLMA